MLDAAADWQSSSWSASRSPFQRVGVGPCAGDCPGHEASLCPTASAISLMPQEGHTPSQMAIAMGESSRVFHAGRGSIGGVAQTDRLRQGNPANGPLPNTLSHLCSSGSSRTVGTTSRPIPEGLRKRTFQRGPPIASNSYSMALCPGPSCCWVSSWSSGRQSRRRSLGLDDEHARRHGRNVNPCKKRCSNPCHRSPVSRWVGVAYLPRIPGSWGPPAGAAKVYLVYFLLPHPADATNERARIFIDALSWLAPRKTAEESIIAVSASAGTGVSASVFTCWRSICGRGALASEALGEQWRRACSRPKLPRCCMREDAD